MFKPEELPQQIADGQYTLTAIVGQGAMAAVYRATAHLDRFDYANLVACHEAAEGASEEERTHHRKQRYELLKARPRAELIELVKRNHLPYPHDGIAAVKVMLPQQKGEDVAQRFEAEWRQLQALNHTNLIQVFGGGSDGRLHWYAMNLVENVIDIDACKAFSVEDKLDMLDQAAAGLSALHERGIIHRDIKPANLLVSREGGKLKTRVMDLGIAKNPNTEGLTMSHHVMGTPYYMSPEQAGSAKRVDVRADVYSLGATLYTLVTGQRPYEGKAMYEVVGHIIRGVPPASPREIAPDLDPNVSALIEAMMAPDIDERLQTMVAVRAAIAAIRGGDRLKIDEALGIGQSGAAARKRATKSKGAKTKSTGNIFSRMFGFGGRKGRR